MLTSLKWLQTYFEQKLPEASRIADLLNFRAFEIDDIKAWDTDEILDVKVLADRACYALSHRGVAGEISVAGNIQQKVVKTKIVKEEIEKKPEIEIKKPALCPRYIGRRVENVKIGKSPEWLIERLESIGERSINNIVDAANFVMFDIGQPLHAFDADKIKGAIEVRLAKKGEKMTTLDNREPELDSTVLIIADKEGPLAIGGVKGGKRAEVTDQTKNLILEAANFNASSVRLTSTALGLKTGAAKRFEANLSPFLADEAMAAFSSLIKDLSQNAKFGPVNDVYKKKAKQVVIEVTEEEISQILGVKVAGDEIVSILAQIGAGAKIKGPKIMVEPPLIRTDLNIGEDIAEEVGRIYGYEKIISNLPPSIRGRAMVNKNFYYREKIKNILIEQGFSEVSLSTFTNKGFFEVAKPLADDKKFLRINLSSGLIEALGKNAQNAPIIGLKDIRLFEVGSVFGETGEKVNLAIGRLSLVKKDGQRNEDILNEVISMIGSALDMPLSVKISSGSSGGIVEIDITDLFRTARSPSSYDDLVFDKPSDKKFMPFSQYPFVLRDIAVFTPSGTDKDEPQTAIEKEGGELLQRVELFDKFEKDGKISFAFHLVFQSFKKTLTDVEVNEVMERITKEINAKSGWQVR